MMLKRTEFRISVTYGEDSHAQIVKEWDVVIQKINALDAAGGVLCINEDWRESNSWAYVVNLFVWHRVQP